MAANWQRLIITTAISALNLTMIEAKIAGVFANEIEESKVDYKISNTLASDSNQNTKDIEENFCENVPTQEHSHSIYIFTSESQKFKIKISAKNILSQDREEKSLSEERDLNINKNNDDIQDNKKERSLNINEDNDDIQETKKKISKIVTKKIESGHDLKEDDLEELKEKLKNHITNLYLYSGYLTSKVEKVEKIEPDPILEDVTDLIIIKVDVSEGYLEEIAIEKVNNNEERKNKNNLEIRNRVSKTYICSRILQAVDVPINIIKLEEQLQLLSNNPLFKNIDATLEATGTNSQSKLVVNVEEANPFTISLSTDNYSPISVGSERLGINLRYLNLLEMQEEFSGSYVSSTTGGAELLDFSYKIPLNPKNGTLSFRVASNNTEVTQSPFDELGIEGEKEIYEITYRQPIVRKLREEFALSLGFSYQEGQTFLGDVSTPFGQGADEDGFSRTSTIQFAQDYTSVDSGGIWSLRSQFNFGTGLLDATINDAPTPDGHYFSWLFQVQRGQRLSQDNLLIVQADLQLTSNSLLSAQQFVIGGGQSVRGYPQNVRSGDNGFRFSIEDRITIERQDEGERKPIIQIAPFIDLGLVWNEPNNPNTIPDEEFLLGAGLGFLWNDALWIKGLNLRIDYGFPFIDLEDRGNNIQDDGLYFQVNYQP